MGDEVRLVGAAVSALLLALAMTPVAIRVANRVGFFDVPLGYKAHKTPTPYLGGAAALTAMLVSGLVFAGRLDEFGPIVAGALFLWIVGTLDDRWNLAPQYRLLCAAAAATLLWATGVGWSLFSHGAADLAFTVFWIVAAVNAFNLMDNMDGSAASVAAVCGTGIGLVALVANDVPTAAFALAVSGACAGFLYYNLAGPARIFLGDGGSMPVGFALGACAMLAAQRADSSPATAVAAAVLLVGLPVLDTALVIVSRVVRGVPVLAGATDHLTHRLHVHLHSPRRVAVVLAVGQSILAACALALTEVERALLPAVVAATLGVAAVVGLLIYRFLRLQTEAELDAKSAARDSAGPARTALAGSLAGDGSAAPPIDDPR